MYVLYTCLSLLKRLKNKKSVTFCLIVCLFAGNNIKKKIQKSFSLRKLSIVTGLSEITYNGYFILLFSSSHITESGKMIIDRYMTQVTAFMTYCKICAYVTSSQRFEVIIFLVSNK